MDIRKSLKGLLAFLVACVVGAVPLLLYLYLLNRSCDGALMYSPDKLWPTIIISVICGSVVWLVLKKPVYREEKVILDDEDYRYDETVEEEIRPAVDNFAAMEEYPELFSAKECSEKSVPASPSYFDTLAEVMASEKRDYVSEEAEKSSVIMSASDLLRGGETDSDKSDTGFGRDMSIYENIPMDLPEGYVKAKVYDPYEDDEDEEEELSCIEEESKVRLSLGETVVSKVVITLVMAAVAFATAFVFSMDYTLYNSESVTLSSVGKKVTYAFEDAAQYIVSPTFFGDDISIVAVMKDGKEVELLPSGHFASEEFFEEYDSVYEYALYACEKMNDNGIEKTVRERKTIEGEILGVEDERAEYIRKIID